MLTICPTPIGNLKDITLRCLEVLRSADLIACEDTRHTMGLLAHYDIHVRLMSFHDHNEQQRLLMLLPLLREGKNVAVVSDAGMPGLSDPGFSLVRACAEEDLPVTVLPGPSAVSTALVLSGLPADRFAFVGFLARGKSKMLEQLAAFEGAGATLVAFESPRRVRASLAAIAERWPDRAVVVCRELTKLHEEALRGTAAQVLEQLADPVKGEIVLVIGAPDAASPALGSLLSPAATVVDLDHRVRQALAELQALGVGTKQAAGVVAGLTGLPARAAYQVALEVKPQSR